METILTLQNVSASYNGKAVLQQVQLAIPKHQITAIIGPTGCGKSTMLRCMNGLLWDEPGASVQGTVCLDGTPIDRLPHEGAAACKEEIVRQLPGGVFAVGNGFNDIPMFGATDLSVAVLEREGLCASLLLRADVLVTSPVDALDLLLCPDRLRATLRS